MIDTANCTRCDHTGWICEEHTDKGWDALGGSCGKGCAGPGMPCPECNELAPHVVNDRSAERDA